MKQIKHHAAILLFAILVQTGVTSCVKETLASEEEQETTLRLGARTRSLSGGGFADIDSDGSLSDAEKMEAKDDFIDDCRVLIFRASTGELAYNIKIENNPDALSIKTGNYHFVFIGNQSSDAALNTQLTSNAWTPGASGYSGKNYTDLNSLYFASSAFAVDKAIPMVSQYRNVNIIAGGQFPAGTNPGSIVGHTIGKITTPGIGYDDPTNVWKVELIRLGVRLDMILQFEDDDMASKYTGLEFKNVPDRVYILDIRADGSTNNYNNGSYENTAALAARTVSFNYTAQSGEIFNGDGTNGIAFGKKGHKVLRTILPASEFAMATTGTDSDKNDSDRLKGIQITAAFGSMENKSAVIGNDRPAFVSGYTAPRNFHFTITGIIGELGVEITCNPTIAPWVNGGSFNTEIGGPI